MKSAYVLAALFLVIATSEAANCPLPCVKSLCPNVTKDNCTGKFVEGGSPCGCCNTCLRIIPKGRLCSIPIFGIPHTSICESGTTCKIFTCQ